MKFNTIWSLGLRHLIILFVLIFWDQNCFQSCLFLCSHGQSKYRGLITPQYYDVIQLFFKNKLQIFLSQSQKRERKREHWNEAVTKYNFICTIWAKVRPYSFHPLPSVIKPYTRTNLSSIFQPQLWTRPRSCLALYCIVKIQPGLV